MPGIKALILLALSGSIGVMLLVLGCALPHYNNWWSMFVLFFYVLSPIPMTIARRYADQIEASSALIEMCLFITAVIVVSAFGLPIVLAHKAVIKWGACALVMSGNIFVFVTKLLYFYLFQGDEDYGYSTW